MLDLTLPLEIAGLLFLVLIVFVAGFTGRRYLLTRSHATFDCAIRDRSGWAVGIARYGPDRIDWHRVFAVRLSPSRTFLRNRLEIAGRREITDAERPTLFPGSVVCVCRYEGEELELALSMDAYIGLTSWSEAAPPGQDWTSS